MFLQLFGGRGSGSYKFFLHEGKQGKHWKWHNNYQEGKSVIKINSKKIQDLVDKYAGKGERHGNKEIVDFKEVIGYYYDRQSGIYYETTKGTIHWSEDGGYHIVPANPNY